MAIPEIDNPVLRSAGGTNLIQGVSPGVKQNPKSKGPGPRSKLQGAAQGPKSKVPDPGLQNPKPRVQGPKIQGQGPRVQGPKIQGQGPRVQGPRAQGPSNQGKARRPDLRFKIKETAGIEIYVLK